VEAFTLFNNSLKGDTIMASKQQHVIKLTGIIDGKPAKTHQADDVRDFFGDAPGYANYFRVDNTLEGTPVLITPKGKYLMIWNNAGYFEPQYPPNGLAIHVSLKRITGNLIYWA
jgi:hypothetical protein